ncbi:hypothetical protein SAMD00019534_069670 [Acytostelium subglobosum LB1]|uniref:hypothetical protein n=1 Tax=Acytostelium subglobosum LB1 TaxID=1410327 RepID=UPI000644CC80|nr:hypothetical protein SAMD00019534_069670 [Acytostelium subglobosum LB1]GAM23792.1 hypothetical protein SAMD00019534_069670 [Acytostelium subglobosum LB1]|eukprot:XP_012753533.1 hypothetical protein SAMD00019534_069670 [Acytostelium subglobosum LB1]
MLPPTLTSLTLASKYNLPIIQGALPPTLMAIVFGDRFNQALPTGVLPSSLKSLTLGEDYQQNKNQLQLPLGLSTLKLAHITQLIHVESYQHPLDLMIAESMSNWKDRSTSKDPIINLDHTMASLHVSSLGGSSYLFDYPNEERSERTGVEQMMQLVKLVHGNVITYVMKHLGYVQLVLRRIPSTTGESLTICVIREIQRNPFGPARRLTPHIFFIRPKSEESPEIVGNK